MIKNTFLGLGPMSLEVIDSLNFFSKKHKKKLMLICSRNQIECKKLGGGYVNNFSTETFSSYIKAKKNEFLIMCRDHGGPFKKDGSNKSLKNEIENSKLSYENDIKHDFKIIHIDTSACGKMKYEIATELVNFCEKIAKKYKKKINFEFGCEEHGVLTNFKKFNEDVKFFSKIKNRQYIVCQTGSLVKSIFQVGQFDIDTVKKMKKIVNKHGILLKEHNGDYLNRQQIQLRRHYGIDAINIAPELGVIQSNLIYNLGKKFSFDKEVNNFVKATLAKGKWKKWLYSKENNLIKFFSSGHYCFTLNEYQNLKYKISKKTNFQTLLNKDIEYNLLKYYK